MIVYFRVADTHNGASGASGISSAPPPPLPRTMPTLALRLRCAHTPPPPSGAIPIPVVCAITLFGQGTRAITSLSIPDAVYTL